MTRIKGRYLDIIDIYTTGMNRWERKSFCRGEEEAVGDSFPRGHLAMSGDIFVCHTGEGGSQHWHLVRRD